MTPPDRRSDHSAEMKEARDHLDDNIADARKKADELRKRDGLEPGDEVGTAGADLLPDDPDDRLGA